MEQRRKRLLAGTAILLGIGFLYAFLCMIVGRALLPCLFHLITGLDCPGCGISRMCLALLRFDFKGAFEANPAVLILLLPGGIIAGQIAVRYVREGTAEPTKRQTVVLWIICVILLLFGVVRNIPTVLSWFLS